MVRILGSLEPSSSTLDFPISFVMEFIGRASRLWPGKATKPGSNAQARDTTQDIPNDSDPSPDAPGTTPRNILAFRTITKLLSLIQQNEFAVSWPNSLADNQELALSTAFATIAVIDHEVVAVVTKVPTPKEPPEEIDVILTTQIPIKNTPIEDTPIENQSTPCSWLREFEFFIAKNFRKKDPPPIVQTGAPTISTADDAGSLPGFALDDDEILKAWVAEHRSKTTMPVHLRVLGRLLSMTELSPTGLTKDASKISERLLRYVIATCYRKIKRRFEHTLSKPYVQFLKQVGAFKIDRSLLQKRSVGRTQDDRIFLTKFFLTTTEDFQASYPTLLAQSKMMLNQDFQLYTEDTCAEFHQLFMFLLGVFGSSLRHLHERRGKDLVPTPCSNEFREALNKVYTSGYALHRLTRGDALRMHLQTICPMDSSPFSQTEMPVPAPGQAIEEVQATEEVQAMKEDQAIEEEDEDQDLEAVQPFIRVNGVVQTHLWKSYLDWLRLMLVQFDAVEVLVNFFAGKDAPVLPVSIHILVPPHVDKLLLSWRKLLTDPTLFPTSTLRSSFPLHQPSAHFTNEEILNFFTGVLVDVPAHRNNIKAVERCWFNRDLSSTIDNVRKLVSSSTLPGWKDFATRLLVRLEKLGVMPPKDDDLDLEIFADINTILQSCRFYTALDSPDSETLSSFEGSLHCEALIASTLGETANVSKSFMTQMQGVGPTIGISKCCCPICDHLLTLLGRARRQPFKYIVRGVHNTVTACTLPTWLPSGIVDSMNLFVGDLLRKELIQLIDHSQLTPRRAESTGSRRLSSGSTGPSNDNNIPISGAVVQN